MGSLFTAVASYCQAKSNKGLWLVRIDDLDSARCNKEYTNQILHTLNKFGLNWDEPVVYQHDQIKLYQSTLERLKALKLTYPCSCTRKQLISRLKHHNTNTYDGYCLNNALTSNITSIRLKFNNKLISFEDNIQGCINKQFNQQSDDLIILRKDNIFAYQLAVCVDDAEQHITEVLRGYDLLSETAGQIYIQKILGLNTPKYAHIPVIVDENGAKLSKQTFANDVNTLPIEKTLFRILGLLNLKPPTDLINNNIQEILKWAVEHWTIQGLSKQTISDTKR